MARRKATGLRVALAALVLGASACQDGRRLDETVFHDGPIFRLKLVRYDRHLFLHYQGEEFSVLCGSEATADREASTFQDAGWRRLAGGGALGSASAKEVTTRERGSYVVIDDTTLVVLGTTVRVSFDACGSFGVWDPTTLPPAMIDPVPKPRHCRPQGTADCRYYDFQDDRRPRVEALAVDAASGRISFEAHSASFTHAAGLHLQSWDRGRTWEVHPLTTTRATPEPATPSHEETRD